MTITAPTKEKPTTTGTKDKLEIRFGSTGTGKCGFCNWPATASEPWDPSQDRTHDHCPVGTLNGNQVVLTRCACPCAADWIKCLTCGLREHAGEGTVSPDSWRCVDPDECAARIERRLAADPTIKMIREIRARVAEEQSAERAARPKKVRYDEEGNAIVRAPAAPRPTSGACLHCGEPTKGGKFLPGHDAAYLSSLAKMIDGGQETIDSTLALMQSLGVSEALQAKLQKRIAA